MADGSALRFALAGILNSPATQKIDFIFGPHHITGAGFRDIATAVLFGRIGIDIDPAKLDSAGAEAMYTPRAPEKFTFAGAAIGKTLQERMTIVHECTHAIVDRNGLRWALRTDNEGAAFMAEALYSLFEYGFSAAMSDVFAGRPDQSAPMNAKEEPFATAMTIARSIQSRPGARVTFQDAMLLRTRIVRHPVYMNQGVTLGTPDMASGLKWD